MPKQFGRFLIVGIINTLVDWGILNILLIATRDQTLPLYALFKSVSFACAVICSYILNKRFVFRSREKSSSKQILAFVCVSLASWILNAGIATYATFSIPFSVFWVKANAGAVLGTLVSLMVNYLGYKNLVFKHQN